VFAVSCSLTVWEGLVVATATKYQQVADDVLRGVGGVENVRSVTHCATRLRFVLNDRAKADKAAVEGTRGVITVVEAGGQFQVLTVADLADDAVVRVADDVVWEGPVRLVAGGAFVGGVPGWSAW
jgi:phosphotransferase system IIB component